MNLIENRCVSYSTIYKKVAFFFFCDMVKFEVDWFSVEKKDVQILCMVLYFVSDKYAQKKRVHIKW